MIITLTGLKNSGKIRLAETWDRNENVSYIKPFTDNPKKRFDAYPFLPTKKLFEKMDEEMVLATSTVNDFTYVYFKSQLINNFNVLVVDDYTLKELKEVVPNVTSVWVDDPNGEDSERVGVIYRKSDYNYIFNYGLDEPDEFIEQVAFDKEILG